MSNFKFGGQSASLEGIDFLVGHGFDFADLNLNELGKIRREERPMIESAERGGIFFTAHAPDLRVDDSAGLARINEAVRYSARFKPRTITIHPILRSPQNTPEILQLKIREIVRLAELAESFGSLIACENTAEEAGDMAEVLDAHPAIVLTLDIGHGELLSERNKSLDFIEAWPDRIRHVHIHDNIGGTTYYEDLHLPLGEGGIDFEPIMKALATIPHEITITFEMPRHKAYESLGWLKERNLA